MTTLTVLAALVAAPFLFGVLLAVALAGVMALHFGRGLISPASLKQPRRWCAGRCRPLLARAW
jgi:hypothetical protein